MKKCTKCGVGQPLENFYKAVGGRDGLRGDCKSCFRERAKARYPQVRDEAIERAKRWREENRERYLEIQRRNKRSPEGRRRDRAGHLQRKYGISLEQYDALLEEQGGVCAICECLPRGDVAFHVDHDHGVGGIRGLLCFRCNGALGDFEDDPELLRRGAEYLTSYRLRQRLQRLRGA